MLKNVRCGKKEERDACEKHERRCPDRLSPLVSVSDHKEHDPRYHADNTQNKKPHNDSRLYLVGPAGLEPSTTEVPASATKLRWRVSSLAHPLVVGMDGLEPSTTEV